MRFIPEDRLNGRVRTLRLETSQILKTGDKYAESQLTLKKEVAYEQQGSKVAEINYKGDGTISAKLTFSYDSHGDLKGVGEYKPDGTLLRKRVYKRKGNIIEETSYRAGSTLSAERVINSYDESGKKISIATHGAMASPSIKAMITYAEGGRIVEVAICVKNTGSPLLASNSTGRMMILLDSVKEQMKSVSPCVDSLLTSRTVFTLNDLGDISETAIYTHDNILMGKERYDREYDSQENWIKEIRAKWNPASNKYEPIEMTKRIITYF